MREVVEAQGKGKDALARLENTPWVNVSSQRLLDYRRALRTALRGSESIDLPFLKTRTERVGGFVGGVDEHKRWTCVPQG